MTEALIIIGVAGVVLWLAPWFAYVGAMLLSLKIHVHIGIFPIGPFIVSALFYLYAIWRWPFSLCPSCGPARRRNGTNPGSTSRYWGRCRHGCRGGEVWSPGARAVARGTRSRHRDA